MSHVGDLVANDKVNHLDFLDRFGALIQKSVVIFPDSTVLANLQSSQSIRVHEASSKTKITSFVEGCRGLKELTAEIVATLKAKLMEVEKTGVKSLLNDSNEAQVARAIYDIMVEAMEKFPSQIFPADFTLGDAVSRLVTKSDGCK